MSTLHAASIFDMNLPEDERRLYIEQAARDGCADDFTLLEAIGGRPLARDERFDRNGDQASHVEEFCSLMGLNSSDEYNATYEQLATSISRFVQASSRQQALTALFRALVCYPLIGNADAHMKNFGVLCTTYEDIHLAPFYDAPCARERSRTRRPAC